MNATQVILLCTILSGCAMYGPEPQPELSGAWYPEYISGKPVIDYSPASMEFSNTGKVSGNASCNSFTGSYTLDRNALSISKVAITRKLCPEALMEQEQRFIEALDVITSAEIVQGMLELKNALGESVIKASPKN